MAGRGSRSRCWEAYCSSPLVAPRKSSIVCPPHRNPGWHESVDDATALVRSGKAVQQVVRHIVDPDLKTFQRALRTTRTKEIGDVPVAVIIAYHNRRRATGGLSRKLYVTGPVKLPTVVIVHGRPREPSKVLGSVLFQPACGTTQIFNCVPTA